MLIIETNKDDGFDFMYELKRRGLTLMKFGELVPYHYASLNVRCSYKKAKVIQETLLKIKVQPPKIIIIPKKQVCRECNEVKNTKTEFYRHHTNLIGYSTRCKLCDNKIHSKKIRDKYSIDSKKLLLKANKDLGIDIINNRKKRKKQDNKRKSRELLRYRVYSGDIKKLPCTFCGNINSNAHHEDYSKPFEVIWLCRKHHMLVHKKYPTEQEIKNIKQILNK